MAGIGRPKGIPKTGGRKPGTPNKINADLKEMILSALDQAGGAGYLLSQAHENPTAFLTLVGKVLPMTVSGDASSPIIHEIRRVIFDPKGINEEA